MLLRSELASWSFQSGARTLDAAILGVEVGNLSGLKNPKCPDPNEMMPLAQT